MKRQLFALGLIICVAGGGYFVLNWWSDRNAPSTPIPATGGRELNVTLSAPEHYLQTDPRWADHAIGGSGEKLKNVGCTICSAATALTAIGIVVTPAQLNQQLKEDGGYTSEGWIVWSEISIPGDLATIDVVHQATHDILDAALEAGDYPLIKFWLPGNIPHWVVIVGKAGQQYMALDPLFEGGAKELSSLTKLIHSVRIIRKSGDRGQVNAMVTREPG